jgi:3-oxoacyl-[acyl-carrier protein] reductase
MVLEQSSGRSWEETVVLVTGSSRGIGAAIALAFGRKRARVAVHYHSRRDSAEEVVAGVHAAGGQARTFAADLLQSEGPPALVAAVREHWGDIHVLVNNASPPIRRTSPSQLAVADLDFFWNAYVRSTWLLTQQVLPGMKSSGFGRIVQILSSAVAGTPPADLAGYVAAKSGLWGLSKALAVDLAPHGITVNAVSPSAVMTDQWDDVPDSHRRAMALRSPMRTLASPTDVANAVTYFASPEARYLTGQNVLLTGGEVM